MSNYTVKCKTATLVLFYFVVYSTGPVVTGYSAAIHNCFVSTQCPQDG